MSGNGAELPLPRSNDPQSLYAWANTVVNTLRRQNVTTTESVDAIEVELGEIDTDRDDTLGALDDYADDVQDAITAAGGFAQSVYDSYAAAAAARHAKLASHYLTEAANRVEQHVRISEDEVLATSIQTVSASLATTNANVTNEITARVNGDSSLASSISTVQTQVNGNSAAITALTESVDGIEARWGIAIDINGRVVGLVQLDGSASGSNFLVVADRFIVSHPAAAGTTITPFVIGLVGGVSTVGINGNLVVDGTIIARHIAAAQINAGHINVSTLSAIAANIGTVTAGKMQSADGKVVFDLDAKSLVMTT